MWQELLTAIALVLVIEGIIPFVKPDVLRKMLETMSEMDDQAIRMTGLVSMLCGVGLLYLVR
ncbi:MAG: DUF2065 domain-containing protein [Gammaproteobacteria bacterium]